MALSFRPFMARSSYQETCRRPMAMTLGCLVLALLLAMPARAEITTGGERAAVGGRLVGGGGGGSGGVSPLVVLEGDVRARCWQAGREILSEASFAGATLSPGLREQAVSLGGAGRSAVLVPFADTFCLLTVSP